MPGLAKLDSKPGVRIRMAWHQITKMYSVGGPIQMSIHSQARTIISDTTPGRLANRHFDFIIPGHWMLKPGSGPAMKFYTNMAEVKIGYVLFNK